jgi:hypothetical protein
MGRTQERALEAKGINVTRKSHGGKTDPGLAQLIDKIKQPKDGKFTHAILHLNGNDWHLPPPQPGASLSEAVGSKQAVNLSQQGEVSSYPMPRFEEAKRQIVDYVINVLKVPEENIWILTPPHNPEKTTKGYSNREANHKRAIQFFRRAYPKAHVPDLIYAGSKSYSDKGKYHLSSDAGESIKLANQIAGTVPGLAKIAKNAPQRKAGPNGGSEASRLVRAALADGHGKGTKPKSTVPRGGHRKGQGGMTYVQTRSGRWAKVATVYAENFQGFINDLENTGYDIKSIGGVREVDPGRRPGWHVGGMAIDINPKQNPCELPRYANEVPGKIQPLGRDGKLIKTDFPPNIKELAARWGLGWGGMWRGSTCGGPGSVDSMHFSMGKNEGGVGEHSDRGFIPLVQAASGVAAASGTPQQSKAKSPVARPGSKTQVVEIIVEEARKAGVDPLMAVTIGYIESSLNPLINANNKRRYKGLYQFGSQYKDEWSNRYGLNYEQVFDARESARAFMRVIKDKTRALGRAGIPTDPYLIYLSWQQGTAGIKTIVKNAKSGTRPSGRIQRNMKSNFASHHSSFRGESGDPNDFLNSWLRHYKEKESYVRRNFGAKLA